VSLALWCPAHSLTACTHEEVREGPGGERDDGGDEQRYGGLAPLVGRVDAEPAAKVFAQGVAVAPVE